MLKPTVAFHIGVHGRESEHLNKLILGNANMLAKRGVASSPSERYRKISRHFKNQHGQDQIGASEREFFIDFLTDIDKYRRLVISYDAFISSRKRALSRSMLYPSLTEKLILLGSQFSDHQIEIVLGIESFATFPSTLFSNLDLSTKLLLESEDYLDFSWINVYERIISVLPDSKVTIFLTENSVIKWPEILRSILGFEEIFQLSGVFNYPIRSASGNSWRSLSKNLRSRPPTTVEQYNEVAKKFVFDRLKPDIASNKFQTLNWSEETQSDLIENYKDDISYFVSRNDVEVL